MTARYRRNAGILALLSLGCLLLLGAGDDPLLRLPGLGDTQYFGVYVKKQKIGWRCTRVNLSDPGFVIIENEAEFVQHLAGREITMKTRDHRHFDRVTGKLLRLAYQMEGPTGRTHMTGVAANGKLTLTTQAGGQTTTEHLDVTLETLRDALAVELAILEGRVQEGQDLTASQFDPSMKKNLTLRFRILPSEERLLAGVMKSVYPVTGQVVEIGAPISALYDTDGRLLQTKMSLLDAVWETEQQARSRIGLGNVLEPLAVRPPKRMRLSPPVDSMTATFEGVAPKSRFETDSQRWTDLGDTARVVVTRPVLDVRTTPVLAAVDRSAFAAWLAREARIQTDDPAIAAQAAKLAKGAATTGELARRILEWVYKSVEKKYTPTFSNASETMKTKVGDCGEHSVLYVALARAAGLPAREVVGLVFSNELGGFGYHAWAEVWMGRWVPVDPSWGQFPADAGRVAFAFGNMEKQAEIVSLMDTIRLIDLEAR